MILWSWLSEWEYWHLVVTEGRDGEDRGAGQWAELAPLLLPPAWPGQQDPEQSDTDTTTQWQHQHGENVQMLPSLKESHEWKVSPWYFLVIFPNKADLTLDLHGSRVIEILMSPIHRIFILLPTSNLMSSSLVFLFRNSEYLIIKHTGIWDRIQFQTYVWFP